MDNHEVRRFLSLYSPEICLSKIDVGTRGTLESIYRASDKTKKVGGGGASLDAKKTPQLKTMSCLLRHNLQKGGPD